MGFTEEVAKRFGADPVVLAKIEYGAKQVILENCNSVAWTGNPDRGHDYAKSVIDTTWKIEGTGSNKVNLIGSACRTDGGAYSRTNGTRRTSRSTDSTVVRKDLGAGNELDLSGIDYVYLYLKPDAAGAYLTFGMGEAAYDEITQDIEIFIADEVIEIKIDISEVADADKNAIRYMQFKARNTPIDGLTLEFQFDWIRAENILLYATKAYKTGNNQYDQRIIDAGYLVFGLDNWEGESIITNASINFSNVDKHFRTKVDASEFLNRRIIEMMGFMNLDIGEFKTIFEGTIRNFTLNNRELAIEGKSKLSKYNKEYPDTFFTLETYPNLAEDIVGIAIPMKFGRRIGDKPYLIETTTGQFKLSSLSIKEITTVYNRDIAITPASTNLANATFTPDFDGFDAVYGGAEDSAFMTITDDFLTLWTGDEGLEAEDQRFDFGDTDYNTIGKVQAAIHATANWTCVLVGAADLPATELEPITSADCKNPVSHLAQLRLPTKTHEYTVDYQGKEDDGSGTYTGSASALIELPIDLVYYLLHALGGMSELTELDIAQFVALRTTFAGYRLTGSLDDRKELFDIIGEISKDFYMPVFTNPSDGKLSAKSADWDNTEVIETQYWETGKNKNIEKDTLLDEGNIDDVFNKVTVRFDYDNRLAKYRDMVEIQDTTSQGDSNSGIDEVKEKPFDCQWLPPDLHVINILYEGAGTCTMTITGEGTDTTRKLITKVNDVEDLSFDFTNASYDTLLELVFAIADDIDYTITIESENYNGWSSLWLRDVTDQNIKIQYEMKYSFGKRLAMLQLDWHKDRHLRRSIGTNLAGIQQNLGEAIGVRSIQEDADKRIRTKQVILDPTRYRSQIIGVVEDT